LCKKGYYLPEYKTRAIHGEYLWKIFTKQAVCLQRTEIKIGNSPEKISKIALLEVLEA